MDFRKEVCGLGLPQWCLVTRLPQARTGWKVVSSRASCSPGGGGIGKRGLGHMSLSSFPFCSSYRSLSLVCLNLIQIIYLVSRCLLSTTMSHYHHYCVTLLLCWVLDTNCLCLQEWDETHESAFLAATPALPFLCQTVLFLFQSHLPPRSLPWLNLPCCNHSSNIAVCLLHGSPWARALGVKVRDLEESKILFLFWRNFWS